MTTKTVTSSAGETPQANPRETLLRRILYGNVAFSSSSAALFILASQQVAEFIGIANVMVFNLINGVTFIFVLGIGLAIFAADILYAVTRPTLNIKKASSIVVADFIWVVLSWILLATGAVPFSDAGNWAVLIVADIVLIFGIAEIVGIRRITR